MKKEKKEDLKTGLAVRDFQTICHLSLEDRGVLTKQGYLDYPGHELDGKIIFKTIITPRTLDQESGFSEWGTPEVTFQVQDGTQEPPVFTDLELLMSHYKIKLVTR